MDSAELARLLYLCARTPGSMSTDAEEELRDLARLAVYEIREVRAMLRTFNEALAKASAEK